MAGGKPKLPTLHPSALRSAPTASIYSINQFILDRYPNIWIHKLEEEKGRLDIKVSGINKQEKEDLLNDLYDRIPAGIKINLRLASTGSEFFKPEPISRPDAPWKDIK